ncbi:MAG TPA: tRNA pseudouridine(55) synthase TruB, partial [Streptosporangiaceae bacterium]
VGHAGTLDPMATDVLVIDVEKATRLLGHLALTEKEYLATIRLGQATDTGDAEGTVTGTADASALTEAAVRAAVATLTGPIQQVPPAVSAIKVGGKRSYALARAGAAPDLPARPVTVWSFEVLASRRGPGVLDLDASVRCSSGTYVRALARDLGEALVVGGHLTMLRRTRVGPYDLALARTLDELATNLTVLPIEQAAAAAFPARQLTPAEADAVSHGRRLPADGSATSSDSVTSGDSVTNSVSVPSGDAAPSSDAVPASPPIAAFASDGTFVALLEEKDGEARPLAVFA